MRELEPALSPRRVHLDHERVEAFRCRVHRGSHPRRSCTHNDHVTQLIEIHHLVETEAVSDLLVRGIAQNDLTTADENRDVIRSDAECVQQLLHAIVGIEIDRLERVAVPREKLPDSQRSGAVFRPDQNGVAVPAPNQFSSPQDQRTRHDFADFCVGLQEPK
jgi:hypothetical protein